MNALQRLLRRVRALLHRDAVERELDEELRQHLELETERHLRAGKAPEEARRAALLTFGGMDGVKEECRDWPSSSPTFR